MPENTGKLVSAEWDFDGTGNFANKVKAKALKPNKSGTVTLSATHGFNKPGTYFVTIRVASQRNGDPKIPFARIQNLDRVRVVVK